ncbi:hypothetical protein VTK26DRAFT_9123 [Humicola hyalothermophila]
MFLSVRLEISSDFSQSPTRAILSKSDQLSWLFVVTGFRCRTVSLRSIGCDERGNGFAAKKDQIPLGESSRTSSEDSNAVFQTRKERKR